jgi:hypothetical protein
MHEVRAAGYLTLDEAMAASRAKWDEPGRPDGQGDPGGVGGAARIEGAPRSSRRASAFLRNSGREMLNLAMSSST